MCCDDTGVFRKALETVVHAVSAQGTGKCNVPFKRVIHKYSHQLSIGLISGVARGNGLDQNLKFPTRSSGERFSLAAL